MEMDLVEKSSLVWLVEMGLRGGRTKKKMLEEKKRRWKKGITVNLHANRHK
jgi:uncharacterized membrane protein